MDQLYLSLTIFGAVALTLGLLSRWLRQIFLSENIIALLAGVIVGPLVLGLIDVRDWPNQEAIFEHVALIVVAIALMEIALKIPKREFMQHLSSYAVLLGGLMPLMWISSSLLVWLILDLPFWLAVLIGAVITPTDPVVATSIVTGPVAERYLPERLRDTIWAESGANDGLAYAFVILPILVIEYSFSGAISEWVFRAVVYDTLFGALVGAAAGYGAAKLLHWAEARHAIDREPLHSFTLVLTLLLVGFGSLIGIEALLAVFIAGVVFHMGISEKEDEEVEEVQGAIDQFFTLPVFTLIGIAIPLQGWIDLGWPAVVLVISVLLLRRLPGALLLSRWIDPIESRWDALFIGWFGPIGIGALFYASFAMVEAGLDEVWVVGTLIICASVVAHGVTATPFSRLHWKLSHSGEEVREPSDRTE